MRRYIKKLVMETKKCIPEVKKAFEIGKTQEDKNEWYKFINGMAIVIGLYLFGVFGRHMVDISAKTNLIHTKIGRFFLKYGATQHNLPKVMNLVGNVVVFGSVSLLLALVIVYLHTNARKINGMDNDKDSKK